MEALDEVLVQGLTIRELRKKCMNEERIAMIESANIIQKIEWKVCSKIMVCRVQILVGLLFKAITTTDDEDFERQYGRIKRLLKKWEIPE